MPHCDILVHETESRCRVFFLFKRRTALLIGTLDRKTALVLAMLAAALIITIAAYFPGLSGPLFLDDLPQLQGMIDHSADAPDELFNRHIVSTSGPFGRSVTMASFLGSAITHGPDTWWWKYENVMFHLITGLLVFWLTALILVALAPSGQKRPWLVAAAVASFWLLHPLHVSTVLYTVQRMTELSSLFVVAGLICYVKGRQRQISHYTNGWLLIGLGFGVFFPLALLSKESALLFPVFCSLIEFLIFQFRGTSAAQKQIKIFQGALVTGYLLIVMYVIVNFSDFVLKSYEFRDFTISERLYTELRIVALYLSQILMPVQGKMGFFHDDITLSTSLFNPITTILSALLLAGLLGSAVALRKRLPLYAFGILFFFVGHALESTIFALELAFEHRNYLPSLGILIAAAALFQPLLKRKRALIWVAIIGLTGFSLLTWQRATTWGSAATMYQFMYYAHPQSKRLTLIFADSYTQSKRYDKARETLEKMGGGLGPKMHNLFIDCIEYGKVDRNDILMLLNHPNGELDGHVAINIDDMTMAALAGRCRLPETEYISLLDYLVTLPSRTIIHKQTVLTAKARILESVHEIDAALGALHAAYELQPDNAMPLYFSAHTLSVAGRLDEATTYLTTAYEIEKTSNLQHKDIAKIIYRNVANMYLAQNRVKDALAVCAQGVLSMPGEVPFSLQKIELLIQLGNYEDAQQTLVDIRTRDTNDIAEYEFIIRRLEKTLQERRDALTVD